MGKIEYWYSEDSYCRAIFVLRRAIGQYARRNRYMYIGLTQQRPEDRFAQHQRKWIKGHKWDRMIVIYHARSLSLMQTVEDELIKHAQTQIDLEKYDTTLINDSDSQAPATAKDPNGFWVYVLVQQ